MGGSGGGRRGKLGVAYDDGDVIVRQGEPGDCMYVIQSGAVEIVREDDPRRRLDLLGPGAFFGEMALFDKEVRSATARAVGEVAVVSVDRRTLLVRISEDPLLAYDLLVRLSQRIRRLNEELGRKGDDP